MTSSYCTLPISKVLGLIAAINPIITAGIPVVRETEIKKQKQKKKKKKKKQILLVGGCIPRTLYEECIVDFNSL